MSPQITPFRVDCDAAVLGLDCGRQLGRVWCQCGWPCTGRWLPAWRGPACCCGQEALLACRPFSKQAMFLCGLPYLFFTPILYPVQMPLLYDIFFPILGRILVFLLQYSSMILLQKCLLYSSSYLCEVLANEWLYNFKLKSSTSIIFPLLVRTLMFAGLVLLVFLIGHFWVTVVPSSLAVGACEWRHNNLAPSTPLSLCSSPCPGWLGCRRLCSLLCGFRSFKKPSGQRLDFSSDHLFIPMPGV